MCLLPFLALKVVITLLSMEGRKFSEFFICVLKINEGLMVLEQNEQLITECLFLGELTLRIYFCSMAVALKQGVGAH